MEKLRIATLSNFSPKKMGSGEVKYLAFAEAVRERGHIWTLFTHEPIHPEFGKGLKNANATWQSLTQLQCNYKSARTTFSQNYDVIELNLIAPRSLVALAAYTAWSCSVYFIDRVSGPVQGWDKPSNIFSRLLDRLTMFRVRQYAGVIEYVRKRGQQRFKLNLKKTTVVYNGVDPDRFSPKRDRIANSSKVILLAVGSLIPEKGFDVLLRAVAKISRQAWQLRIIGEGVELGKLESLVRELEIQDNVEFLGLRDDVAVFCRESDIFIHPAVWEEAFGHTVVEGMSSGCCVIASRVGGIPELVEHEREGILLEPGNVNELTKVLSRAIDDKSLRRTLGAAARKRVLKDFTLQQCVNREIDLLEGKLRD